MQKMKDNKTSTKAHPAPSTKAARIAGGRAGREQKKRYLALKSFAIEREKKNFSKLLLIHEKEEWWKMVGNSAIIFFYEVSKWAGIAAKLVPDSDYEFRSEEGVVNIRDVYLLDRKLAAIKINPIDIKDDYRVYNIGKKYTPSDIAALRKTQELEWAKVNKIILPKTVFPFLYTSLRELLNKVYFTTKAFEGYAREIIGMPMFEKVSTLVREYSLMSNQVEISTVEYLEKVDRDMQWITAQMTSVAELKLVPTSRIYQILRAAEKVRRCVEQSRPKAMK